MVRARAPLGFWSKITFELRRSDGAIIDIELLRPDDWLNEQDIESTNANFASISTVELHHLVIFHLRQPISFGIYLVEALRPYMIANVTARSVENCYNFPMSKCNTLS